MDSTIRQFVKLIGIFTAVVLASCGGGGGSEGSSSTPSTYTISGTISGEAFSGVTVNLNGATTVATTTDSSGNYTFTGLANSSYTVAPSLAGYTFSPTNTAVNISGANVSGTNFTATANVAPTYTLLGTVTGAVTSNVLVTLSGAATATTLTNNDGNYSFTGLTNGTYTSTPSLAGYSFNPINNATIISGANATVGNFVATAVPTPTYNISGAVSGAVLSGVRINFTGAATVTGISDTSGNFILSGPLNGNYTVTPMLAGYTFSPANMAVTVSGANVSGINFIATANSAPTYSLSGTITGAVLQNVLITLSGAGSATTLTNASGNYSFSGLMNGSYTATPSLTGYSFSPTSNAATISGANTTFGNFVVTAVPTPTYTITGAVSGAVLSGVYINLTGAATASTTTNSSGNYSFTGLTNGSHTVTPSLTGYTFNPTNTAVNISGSNINGTNFTATASIAPTYSLTGTVSGAVLSNVLITLSGSKSATTLTNASGNYSFSGLTNGSYAVTPFLTSYSFSPTSNSATISGANATAGNFVALSAPLPTYKLSGSVSGSILPGVNISLSGAATASATTDASGNFSFTNLANGSYRVRPSLPGYGFTPFETILTISGTNTTASNFVEYPMLYWPTSLQFSAGSSSPSQTVKVTNAGPGLVKIFSITTTGYFSTSALNSGACAYVTSLSAGASCTISVHFNPPGFGGFYGDLIINMNADGNSAPHLPGPNYYISLQGEG